MNQTSEFYLSLIIGLIVLVLNLLIWPTELNLQLNYSSANVVIILGIYAVYFSGYILCTSSSLPLSGSVRIRVFGWFIAFIAASAISLLFIYAIAGFLFTLLIIRLTDMVHWKIVTFLAVILPVLGTAINTLLGQTFEYPNIAACWAVNGLALTARYRWRAELRARQALQRQTPGTDGHPAIAGSQHQAG